MIEEKILQELGLTDIEAKIYLASLELGSDSVLRIAKKAEVKRPTAYVALDNLANKGYVSKIEKGNVTNYTAEDPSVILNKYKERVANFTDLLPLFRAKFNRGPKPKIRYYEGRQALYDLYTKIIFPSKQLLFFGADLEKLNSTLPEILKFWITSKYRNEKKDYRELIMFNKEGVKIASKLVASTNLRVMPKNLPVYNDSVVTENRVIILSLDNLFGVSIESEDIAKSFKSFYELAWRGAEVIK